MKKKVLSVLIGFLLFPVLAESTDFDIFKVNTPILYGREDFVRRIEERTEGTRQPLGLVLSGGSARAFAHLGVIRYLEEIDVVPDFIVTNSMGSIVGLLYAAGLSPDQIFQAITSIKISYLFQPSIPLSGGILDVSRLSSLLHSILGEQDLKDLPIPVMLLCEDLISKRQIQITEGDFYPLLEASFALPFYFPPVEFRGHLLIDGGVSNILPLSPAYDYSDQIILSTTFYNNPDINLKNALTVLNVAIDVAKSRTGIADIEKHDPLLIRCDVESFSFMDFDKIVEIQEAGYLSARAMTRELTEFSRPSPLDFLGEKREKITDRRKEFHNRYIYQGSFPIISPSARLTTGLTMNDYPEDEIYLLDDIFFHVNGDFAWRGFRAELKAGGIWDAWKTGEWYPGTELNFSQFLTYNLTTKASWRLSFKPSDNNINIDGSYLRGEILYTPLALDNFRVDTSAVIETTSETIIGFETSLLTLQTMIKWDFENFGSDIALKGGYQLEDYENDTLFGDLQLNIPLGRSWALWNRSFTRHPLDESGEVYSYRRDYFRAGEAEKEYRDLIFNNFQITFNPDSFHPTFGEVFILKTLALSAYGDTGWFDEFIWGSGLEVKMELSFIGLKPLGIFGYAGYNSASRGLTGGIFISTGG